MLRSVEATLPAFVAVAATAEQALRRVAKREEKRESAIGGFKSGKNYE